MNNGAHEKCSKYFISNIDDGGKSLMAWCSFSTEIMVFVLWCDEVCCGGAAFGRLISIAVMLFERPLAFFVGLSLFYALVTVLLLLLLSFSSKQNPFRGFGANVPHGMFNFTIVNS